MKAQHRKTNVTCTFLSEAPSSKYLGVSSCPGETAEDMKMSRTTSGAGGTTEWDSGEQIT